MRLFDLPHIALDKILSYLSYDEVSKLRVVCKQFDNICKQRLNIGFTMAERYHAQCWKAVKTQLPRRESERRSHPLCRHNEVLTALETRLSMLSMTYLKFIDLGMCCFIPGKVIDEIFKILYLARDSKSLPRSLDVLQELRDISSMAMEHFEEKILPFLRGKITLNDPAPCLLSVTSQVKENKTEVDKLKDANKKLNFKLRRQQKQLSVQRARLQELDAQVAELRRTVESSQHRNGDVSVEMSRARESPSPIPDPLPCTRKRRQCSASAHVGEASKVPRR
ncbi:F-box only protein 28 isoform X2 [Bacillus rossius redtenbacheri]|uniref:F-box only protein 28 isoform X2 n=1 Tax=Bacillus rossius redtenbacheri TaxID=93214 RepID=UPI002FDE5168